MIYFDSAATSYTRPESVAQAVYQALLAMGNPSRGVHGAALSASRMVYEAREKLCRFFGADGPEQAAFTSGATESLNLVIQSLFAGEDHVIATALDHNSVLRPLYRKQKEEGMALTVLPADSRGNISYEQMMESIGKDTKAVICTHASNVTGNVLDIRRIGEICRRKGVLFVLDASQTAGVFPIHMKEDQIDILCFTGHKGLLGPQGTGGILAGSRVKLKPVKVGGSGYQSESMAHPAVMPAAMEAGTLNCHGIAGLSRALDWIEERGMEQIREIQLKWTRLFYQGIRDCKGVRIYGDFSVPCRAPVVSLNLGEEDSGAVADCLWEKFQIAVRSGFHCAYPMHQALGTQNQGTVRFSFSCFQTKEEVEKGIEAVKKLAEEWRL